jgi:hypothetical protein
MDGFVIKQIQEIAATMISSQERRFVTCHAIPVARVLGCAAQKRSRRLIDKSGEAKTQSTGT